MKRKNNQPFFKSYTWFSFVDDKLPVICAVVVVIIIMVLIGSCCSMDMKLHDQKHEEAEYVRVNLNSLSDGTVAIYQNYYDKNGNLAPYLTFMDADSPSVQTVQCNLSIIDEEVEHPYLLWKNYDCGYKCASDIEIHCPTDNIRIEGLSFENPKT